MALLRNFSSMLIAAFCVSVFLTPIIITLPVAAQDKTNDPDHDQLKAIEKRLEQRRKEEARLKDAARARAREVRALRSNMVETANALQSAETRIAEINDEMARLEAEETTITEELLTRRGNLGDVLAALQSLERSRPPALLVSPEDAAGAARTAMLLADAAPTIEAKAAALRASLDRLQTVRVDLAREREKAQTTNAEIGDRRRVLADLLQRKQRERDVAARLAAAAQSETAALAARASTLNEVISRLERLARAITPRLKPRPPQRPINGAPEAPTPKRIISRPKQPPGIPFKPPSAFSKARGALKAPVVGEMVGRFGDARTEGGRLDGIRYAVRANAIVTAPFDAHVEFARSWNPIGNLIVLDVGEGYRILILGVGAFLVEEGQTVSAGEPIAAMAGEDAELDLEIRKNRRPVNPLLWLSRKTG